MAKKNAPTATSYGVKNGVSSRIVWQEHFPTVVRSVAVLFFPLLFCKVGSCVPRAAQAVALHGQVACIQTESRHLKVSTGGSLG